MKKFAFMTLILSLLFLTCACAEPQRTQRAHETTLTVFAAASLSGVLSEIAELYTAEYPEVNIIFNFDSSGTLRTQIMEGAATDIFFSAATREMEQLEEAGLLLSGTTVNILENQVVLVAADDSQSEIANFSDMTEALITGDVLMAMGNMDVPAGRYAEKLLQYFGLDHTSLANTGVITYASNVRAVATQVREGNACIGIVYLTDAMDFGLHVLDIATAEMIGQVIYPAAVLSGSQNTDAAQSFLDFLQSDTAMAVFHAGGFLSPT